MEVLLVLLVLLFVIGLPLMMIVALVRLGFLREELADLKRRLDLRQMLEERKDSRKMENEETKAVDKEVTEVRAPQPVRVPQQVVECRPPDVVAAAPSPVTAPQPLTAMEMFWMKIEDWLAVRGTFAPKGVTHEFAFATHWLVRVGALLLVGAIAYFLMLAIDRGWIGPVQRVYGMMAWGVVGTAFGT